MRDELKTKKQLINELKELRQRAANLEEVGEKILQARFGRILDNTFNEIYIFDQKTLKFIYANHGSLQNLGYVMEKLENAVQERTEKLIVNNIHMQREIEKRKEIEKLLMKQLNFLQLMIDTIPNPAFYKDKNGLFQGCNTSFEKYIGLTSKEIIGKSVYEVYPKDLADIYFAKDTELFNTLGIQIYETSFQIADGTRRDIVINRAAYLDVNGNVAGIVGVIVDITERKQMENSLRESEERYRQLVELSPDTIIVHSEGEILFVNHAGAEQYQVKSPENLVGKPLLDLIHPDYREVALERLKILDQGMAPSIIEQKHVRLDGTEFDVEITAAPLIFRGKRAAQAVVRDITWRKQVEEQIKAERERFFSLLNGLPAIVYLYDGSFSIRFANSYFNESFGEPGGRPCYEILRGLQEPCDNCSVNHVLDTQKMHKWERTYPNGRTYQVYNYPYLDSDGTNLVLSLGIDITERKRIEEALWDSQLRYAALLKALPVGLVQIDSEGTCVYNNVETKKITGFSSKELINNNWLRTVHPQEKEQVMAKWERALKRQGIFKMEFRYLRPDDRVSWVIGQAVPFKGRDQKLLGYICTLSDITDRKASEESLRLSEERFYKAFNANPSSMIISSAINSRIIEVNKSFELITGYQREEAIGRTSLELNLYNNLEEHTRVVELTKQGSFHNREIRLLPKSGQVLVGLLSVEPIELNGEPCLLELFYDTTERKQMEKEMERLERLSLIGKIAAGIGHEIRNPLTTVRGFLQLLGEKQESIQYKEFYDLMIEELDRANGIISEFLLLAKDKVVDLKTQNLNRIIKTMLPLIEADAENVDKNILLNLQEVRDLPLNENEIRQLILNLVRNGLEAMEKGGILTIRTFQEGNELALTVQDQGTGIHPDILDKVGIPFCSSKENGTGLGLAVCYSIAARHNAVIKFETGPLGTIFFVWFKL